MQVKISFKNNRGERLNGIVHVPKKYNPKIGTAVVSLHGFPGSGMGKRSAAMGRFLEKQGLLFLRFDFSGSNTSEGNFEDKLMSQEVKEIKYAIDFLQKNYGFKRLILLSHSTGAIDASLYAYKDNRISKLVLSGCVTDLKTAVNYDFNALQVRSFWQKGFIVYKGRKDAKGKKHWVDGKKLKKAFYDEFFTLDIEKAMKKYRRPVLIIHGEKDSAVPLFEAREMFRLANKPKKLEIVKDADHNYSGRKHREEYYEIILKFVR